MRKITEADLIDGRYPGNLDLRGYKHPLPAALTSIGGGCYLRGYEHPLPSALTSIGMWCDLRGYEHAYHAGEDLRGYLFSALRLASGIRVIAGCRNFSVAEARAHWSKGTEQRDLAEKAIKMAEDAA